MNEESDYQKLRRMERESDEYFREERPYNQGIIHHG